MEKKNNSPFFVMAKPVGAACNLSCSYCYYLEKMQLYASHNSKVMDDTTLELFIRQYIQSNPADRINFTWHGGEALLRPLEFYQRALELQKKYADGKIIENSLQTNGTLLDDRWCRFLKQEEWLVGISIDGPQRFHDEYRLSPDGKPSFQRVMKGIRLLQKHRVKWNAMAVVNDYNADYPLEFYRFFKRIGCNFIQFTPIVERRINPDGTFEMEDFSVTAEQWGEFLCAIFNEWSKEDVGKVFVQIFDATLANWVGVTPGLCTLDEHCGHAAALEFNGDLYSCDHFVFPEFKLGNIREHSIGEMMSSKRRIAFGEGKKKNLSYKCKQCQWLFLCNGECPKNRFNPDLQHSQGFSENYLCAGYKRFFEHSAPFFRQMAASLPKS